MVYSVSQISTYIKNMFTQDYLLQSLEVGGEISNCKYHSSGHIYFTLKDERSQLACVMFAGNARSLTFRMADGMKVIVRGSVDVYERDGKYQLYARSVRQDGAGILYERYLALKEELESLGMFAPEYKRPIPRGARTIGIVTAPTGAAVRDILNIARRRDPYVQLILYPAIVQGEAAAPSIVRGIKALEAYGVDVIIAGRGGGSIEDLWAFNEREVAQAIFDCSVPVISAVGHETDFTIADFVADMRAPTPSAAAELATAEVSKLLNTLEDAGRRLGSGIRRKILTARSGLDRDRELLQQEILRRIRISRNSLDAIRKLLEARSPEMRLRRNREDLVRLEERMGRAMSGRLKKAGAELEPAGERLERAFRAKLTDRRSRFVLAVEKLRLLSPLHKLSSGYSYVEDETGANVRSVAQVRKGDALRIRMTDGIVDARAEEIHEDAEEDGKR
ncbi:MAG: exodeoxyribonuclease VII large subunit [Lachnospiraceae bacterium]|nr:exodeoxyribonuclease VII large subunit [Lachnospiraceae bacterium]